MAGSSKLEVRLATESDFRAFFAQEPPPIWWGMVALDGNVPVAFGSVMWDGDGQAWCGFDKAEHVSPVLMHRTAVRAVRMLQAIGEPVLYATCRDDIQGARRWLERLGFKPDADRPGVMALT